MGWRLETGDCVEVLATLAADSVDACVTDPPYGIGMMAKARLREARTRWETGGPLFALERTPEAEPT